MNANNKIKVFVVEDDKMFAESLIHSLSGGKTEIMLFPTGEECLKKLEGEDAGIVILDYYLNSNSASAMNGVQVLNKIKQINPETEVIMLSSQDDVSVAVDTLKYGAYDYIAKGKSAFVKIQNDIKRISDGKDQADDFDKETKRLRKLNIIIVVVVIIAFVLSRIL